MDDAAVQPTGEQPAPATTTQPSSVSIPVTVPDTTQPKPAGEVTPPPATQTPPEAKDAPKPTETPPPATDFKVPDEYKDKPWASKVKSLDDVWKQLANTQELVGKKSIVPDLSKMNDKEREEYFAQSRPTDPNVYVFPENTPIDPTMKEGVQKDFMELGIDPYRGSKLIEKYQAREQALLAEQFNPDGFKKTMETAFGKDWDTVTKQSRQALKNFTNAEDDKALDALPNAYLGIIYRTLGNIVKAYGVKETDQAHLQGGGKPAASDVSSVRQGLRDQMSAMTQRPHTAQEMQTLINQLNETYKNDPRLAQGR